MASHAILCVASAVILLPLIWVLRTSTAEKVTASQVPPDLFFVPTLANYVEVLGRFDFGGFFLDGMVVALGTTPIAIALGALAAYAIDRYRVGGPATPTLILATQMLPPITLVVPFFLMFPPTGLTDAYAGLILAYLTFILPYVVWVMMSFFKQVPRELDEAALIDGCTPFSTFVRVVLPAALPGIGAAAVMSFVFCWNEFLFALMLAGEDSKTPSRSRSRASSHSRARPSAPSARPPCWRSRRWSSSISRSASCSSPGSGSAPSRDDQQNKKAMQRRKTHEHEPDCRPRCLAAMRS